MWSLKTEIYIYVYLYKNSQKKLIDLKVKKFAQKKTRHLLFLLTGTSAKIIGFLKKKDEKFKVKIVNRTRKPRIIFKKTTINL